MWDAYNLRMKQRLKTDKKSLFLHLPLRKHIKITRDFPGKWMMLLEAVVLASSLQKGLKLGLHSFTFKS